MQEAQTVRDLDLGFHLVTMVGGPKTVTWLYFVCIIEAIYFEVSKFLYTYMRLCSQRFCSYRFFFSFNFCN